MHRWLDPSFYISLIRETDLGLRMIGRMSKGLVFSIIAICVIASVGIGMAFSTYNSVVGQKESIIATQNSQIDSLNQQIDDLNATIRILNSTIHGPKNVTSPESSVTYTIWHDAQSDDYYAKNGITDDTYHDGNFTQLFKMALDDLPSEGGVIHLKTGVYKGWIIIDRDGMILEGEGVYGDVPTGIPDNPPPTSLKGTVLQVTTPEKDGIHIKGQRYSVQIKDLGIWFTRPNTGNGITDDMDQNYHLTYCTFSGIMILDHDKSHYAIQMSNFLHLTFNEIRAWGGPFINLYCNKEGFQAGNSNFYNVYGYIKYDLSPVRLVEGPYPIFVHKNDSLSILWVNFLHFYRVQINCPASQSDPEYYTVTLWDCRYSTFEGFDLEGMDGNKLQMGSCEGLSFINALMWSMPNNLYVNIASSNKGNVFLGCTISKGVVLDACATDDWVGCTIEASLHKDSKAHFYDLPGNSGTSTLRAGNVRVNVTAKLIGEDYMVFLQPFAAESLQPGEALKVEAVYYAPANYFTVTCIDGNPASSDIGFYWIITLKNTEKPP